MILTYSYPIYVGTLLECLLISAINNCFYKIKIKLGDFDIKNIAPWMTESWLHDIPITNLYISSMKDYALSEFAFFLIDDNWDIESLTNLKYKAGAAFLFGLQTTSKRVNKLDVVDGIIVCKPNEVKQVIEMFEVMSNRQESLVTTDFDVIKQALQFREPAQFIQATATGGNKLDRAKIAINQLISQIPQSAIVDVVILRVKTESDLSIEEYSIVSAAVEERVTDDISIWYDISVIDTHEQCEIEAIYIVK